VGPGANTETVARLGIGDEPTLLQKMFEPRSIAVYGASSDPRSPGHRALSNLIKSGFPGEIVPINPRYTEVAGYRCYPSAQQYEGHIDHGMCVVGAERVIGVARDCAVSGIKTLGVYAAGFAEIGAAGRKLQRQLQDVTKKGGIRVLGPNCYGYANGVRHVTASMGSLLETVGLDAGGLGIVSQSGSTAAALLNQCKAYGVDVGFLVSTGNEMDIEIADCIDYLCDVPGITRIALYVEGIRDVERLKSSLRRARRQGKDVIVLRAGRTSAGRAAVRSHTASLVTDARLYEALFRELGAITVSNLRELADLAHVTELPTTANEAVAIVTSSGAAGALAADACVSNGLPLARIARSRQAALKAVIPYCTPTNPVDMTGQNDFKTIRSFLSTLLDEPSTTRVVFLYGSGMWSPGKGGDIATTLAEIATTYGADRLIFVGDAPEHVTKTLRAARIPMFDDAAVLLGQLGRVRTARLTRLPPDGRRLPATSARTRVLLESTALGILERAGVPVVRRVLVEGEAGVRKIGSSLGFPVIAKAVLSDVTHKAKIGAIRSGLGSADELRRAWAELAALARARREPPRVLFETEIEGIRAEILISAFVDPILGPFVGIASGGTLTELLDDIAFVPIPVTAQRVRRVVEGLRTWPLISRDRAHANADLADIAAAVLAIQGLIGTAAEGQAPGGSDRIRSIEVNPLLLGQSGSWAVDAVIEVAAER
jgi:acyl-CoA synthetase (NDP forming)